MPILSIKAEGREPVEVSIKDIEDELNEILKDEPIHLTSPGNTPTIENSQDKTTGHIKAGSEVFYPQKYSHEFENSQNPITYTFLVKWDENISNHHKDKHWNLIIFKTIHLNGKAVRRIPYPLPKIQGIDHVEGSNWIQIEILDDNRKKISSKIFYHENSTYPDQTLKSKFQN